MKTNIARVCQIDGQNFVDYKGERLTVDQYNLKYKRNIRIPKEVKVCEDVPTHMFTPNGSYELKSLPKKITKELVDEMFGTKHGSRAKKEECIMWAYSNIMDAGKEHKRKCPTCRNMAKKYLSLMGVPDKVNIVRGLRDKALESDIDIPEWYKHRVQKREVEEILSKKLKTPSVRNEVLLGLTIGILLASLIIHSLNN